ncbi:MAG: HDIG domain-containing protein [Anaerolineae bacterium]
MNVRKEADNRRRISRSRTLLLIALAVLYVVLMVVIVAYPSFVSPVGVTLTVGQVAREDVLAPRSLTYESEVLTRLSQQAAESAVPPVYDPPDPSVLRQQIKLARTLLDYVSDIRSDSYSTREQQIADLYAISAVTISNDVYDKVLKLNETDWKQVDSQVMGLLERTMRGEIREDTLTDIYANLPNLVGISVSESQAQLIVEIARPLIRPNSFYNEERTKEAKARAVAAVPTETRSFVQGQIVVRAGQIVTDSDLEALTRLNLLQPTDHRVQTILSGLLLVLLTTMISLSYVARFHIELLTRLRDVALVGLLLLIFVAGSRMFDVSDPFQSHLYPAAAFALIAVTIAIPQVAVVLTATLGVLIGVALNYSLEMVMLVSIGGIAGVLTLRRVERINAFFLAGLVIGVVNVGVAMAFLLSRGQAEPTRVLAVTVSGLLNGVLSAGVGLVGLYVVSSLLNLPTSIRLLELSQPGQPLLQRLLREAPGTYQHSLQVANLAEQAAERIGANALMVRVGALYHDIGKMIAPHYFVENQAEGGNPHDLIKDPVRSSQIIISHVTEGEKMGRKHHLPDVLLDYIMEHHGTTQTLYFYNKALEAVDCDESKIDKRLFTYPGPRPRTRESGILMLADTCESVVRAKRPQSKQEIEQIVSEIFQGRLSDGQLDQSRLTLNDLQVIREVFVSTLQGIFHPRIAYPPNPTQTQEMRAVQVPAQLPPPAPPALPIPPTSTSTMINAEDFE